MTTDQSTPERSDALALPKADKAGWSDIDVRAVDTARLLVADAVQKVGNGHPGTAMSLAPVAYLIYQNLMTYDPTDTEWIGRDRFVLSNGHSSLTQYIQLYLGGFGLSHPLAKKIGAWPAIAAVTAGGTVMVRSGSTTARSTSSSSTAGTAAGSSAGATSPTPATNAPACRAQCRSPPSVVGSTLRSPDKVATAPFFRACGRALRMTSSPDKR